MGALTETRFDSDSLPKASAGSDKYQNWDALCLLYLQGETKNFSQKSFCGAFFKKRPPSFSPINPNLSGRTGAVVPCPPGGFGKIIHLMGHSHSFFSNALPDDNTLLIILRYNRSDHPRKELILYENN